MPRCGSQIFLCDVPVRIDSYYGCSHKCKYCFTLRKGYRKPELGETAKGVLAFIKGKRNKETRWCDWNIPLHLGGVSDPFQPMELKYKRSYELLDVFAKTQYPFIFSTKGRIVASKKYLDMLQNCNVVGQLSMLSPQYDKIEKNAPPYSERLEMLEKIVPVCKRTIVRLQPYTPDVLEDVISSLSNYANMGVYGITVEGLKVWYAHKGLVRVAGDFTYPKVLLESHYQKICTEAHRVGLKFFAGENRLRNMGDSLCCCGSEGLEGFIENKSNLNHYFFGKLEFRERMLESGTGYAFKTLFQDTLSTNILKTKSYAEMMEKFAKTKKALEIFGFSNS